MLINKEKTEYQNILDHINKLIPDNEPKIQEGEISFSNPQVIPGEDLTLISNTKPNDSYIYNTIITVTPAPQFSWELPTTVEYRRVDLLKQHLIWTGQDKGSSASPLIFNMSKQRTVDNQEEEGVLNLILNILPFLRRESLRVIKVEDLQNGEIGRFKVVPIENSLLYIGEIYVNAKRDMSITPTPTPSKIPLNTIFTSTITDSNGTPADQGDGFEYFESMQDE